MSIQFHGLAMPDERAARYLEPFRRSVYRAARHLGLQPDDAEDCAQMAVLRLLQATGPNLVLPAGVNHPRAWLRACARHVVADFMRSLAARRKDEEMLTASDSEEERAVREVAERSGRARPEQKMERDECWHEIGHALRSLTERQCFFFVRHTLIEEPIEGIAATESLTPKQVHHVIENARLRLRTLLLARGVTLADLRRAFDELDTGR